MIADLLFILFAAGILLGGLMVIAARNPMVGVMGMIFAFLNASGLFILFGAEFLGLLMIMVYVGAIAVMFLFVLMTIDIDYIKLKEGLAPYLPVGLLVVGLLAAELIFAAWAGMFTGIGNPVAGNGQDTQNVVALGQVLFTTYALPFQIAGLVLLTAMVGAIVLTHHPRTDVKRQNIGKQIFRDRLQTVQLAKPKLGQGATAKNWQPETVEKKVKEED